MTKAEAIKELMRCAELCQTTPLAEACWMAAEALQYKDVERLGAVQARHEKWIREDYWSEGVGMGESYGYYYKCPKCGNLVRGGYNECGKKYCDKCGAKNGW